MRLLVTAASRHGSTAEIATELGKALRGGLPGVGVNVVPIDRVAGFADYDAVVLGSAVYFGRWLDEARWPVTAHEKVLREQPVWLFSSGPVGVPSVPDDPPQDAAEFAVRIGAREHVVFSGALNRELLEGRERYVAGLDRVADGDYRDWPAVRAWADRIATDLRIGAVPHRPPRPAAGVGGPKDPARQDHRPSLSRRGDATLTVTDSSSTQRWDPP